MNCSFISFPMWTPLAVHSKNIVEVNVTTQIASVNLNYFSGCNKSSTSRHEKNKRQKHDSQLAKVHSSTTHFANNSHTVQLCYTHTSCYFEQLPPILPKLFVSDRHGQCETESRAGKLLVMGMHCLYTSRALTSQASAK